MGTHTREPGQGHQLLMAELHGVLDRFETQGITKIEQVALLAQLVGQKISDLDPDEFDNVPEVMQAVALNIATGNAQKGSRHMVEVIGHG
jgi:hypothetical protein